MFLKNYFRVAWFVAGGLILSAAYSTAQSMWPAANVQFTDASTVQAKFNSGDLGAMRSTSGVTYPKTATDSLAIGGTDSTAPIFFDLGGGNNGSLVLNTPGAGVVTTPAATTGG